MKANFNFPERRLSVLCAMIFVIGMAMNATSAHAQNANVPMYLEGYPPLEYGIYTNQLVVCQGGPADSVNNLLSVWGELSPDSTVSWAIVPNPASYGPTKGIIAGTWTYNRPSTEVYYLDAIPMGFSYTPPGIYQGFDYFTVQLYETDVATGGVTIMSTFTVQVIVEEPAYPLVVPSGTVCAGSSINLGQDCLYGGDQTGSGLGNPHYNAYVNDVPGFVIWQEGGSLGSSNPSVAVPNSAYGTQINTITGAGGSTVLTYTVNNACGTSYASAVLNVSATPVLSIPNYYLCAGATELISTTVGGGTWANSGPSVATLDASGNITGVAPGNDYILYTAPDGCGATIDPYVEGVYNVSASSTSICIGTPSYAYEYDYNATTGGAWSSSNTNIATVDANGTITGVTAGTVNISYTAANTTSGCGSTFGYVTITVNPSPAVITVPSPVIVGGPVVVVSDATAGGTWSGGFSGALSIDALGNVTAITTGYDNIYYTLPTGCNTSAFIQVYPFAFTAGTSQSISVCGNTPVNIDAILSVLDVNTTGTLTWSINSPPSFGTINNVNGYATSPNGSIVSTSGATYTANTGISGFDYFTISITNGAYTYYLNVTVTINPIPETIYFSNTPGICLGGSPITAYGDGSGIWSGGTSGDFTIDASGNITGVSAGVDNITYTNPAGCYVTASVTVEDMSLVIATNTDISTCAGSDGAITTTLTDGTAPFVYTWYGSEDGVGAYFTPPSTGGNVSGLSVPGYYQVYVNDAFGCQSSAYAWIYEPDPIYVTGTIATPTQCLSADGSISLSVSGDVPTDIYKWSNGSTSENQTGLLAGTYSVTVTDHNNCFGVAFFTLVQPDAIYVDGNTTDPTCFNGANGSVNILSVGGSGFTPYNYSWSNGTTNEDVSGLAPGTYTVTVTDAHGCYSNTPYTINPHGDITFTYIISNVSTVGGHDGAITGESLSGLTYPWSYSWSNGVSGTDADWVWSMSGLTAGLYSLTFTDANSCVKTYTFSVTQSGDIAPTFNNGATQPLTVCINAAATSINALLVATDADAAQTETWSVLSGPAHGTLSGFNTTAASGGAAITPAGLTYMPTAGYSGTDAFTIQINDGNGGTASTTINVTVNPLPVTGTITGTASITEGSTTTLVDGVGGGVWSSDNTPVAVISGLGVVSGVSIGTANISYAVTGTCGTAYATFAFTVTDNAPVFTNGATQPLVVCINATATSINSLLVVTDPDAAQTETWSVLSSPAHGSLSGFNTTAGSGGAAITPAGLTYKPTAGYSGTDAFVIHVSDGHGGTATTTINVTVNPLPATGTITGTASITAGSTTTLVDGIGGGIWSSVNAPVAAITTLGVVSGVSVGTSTISYTVTGDCGTAAATFAFAVTDNVPSFNNGATQPLTVCINASATTINSLLVVTDPDASQTETWSVLSAPGHGTLSGFNTTASSGGGAITAAATLAYTPSAGYSGADAFTIQVSDGYGGTASTTINVTVNPLPATGTISGTASIAMGATTTLIDGVGGGVWSSDNAPVAAITNLGVVSGVTAGIATISYAVTGACGTAYATFPFTVTPPADVAPTFNNGATQPLTVCINATATSINSLLVVTDPDAAQTETWSVLTAPIHGFLTGFSATAGSGGSAITPAGLTYTPSAGYSGTDAFTIQVSDGNGGTASTTINVTVNPLPATGTISGATSITAGSTTTLVDGAGGGVWSSVNAPVAAITLLGVVSGVSVGSSTISYTVTGSCGTAAATYVFSVTDNAPTFNNGATQPLTVCINAAATSINSLLVVTDLDASQTETWYVLADPSHGTLSGFNATAGSGSSAITPAGLTYKPTTGYSGTDVFTIQVSDGYGNTATTTINVTVTPLPATGTISGTASIPVGGTTTLIDGVGVGVWSSDNAPVAAISGLGVVSGVTAGTATISYGVTGSCGTAYATFPFTVTPAADVAPTFNNGATQPLTVCINAAATSINSLLVVTDPDAAQTETWSVLSGPAHGTLAGFNTTAGSGGAAINPAGLTYMPAAGYSGADAFTIQVNDGNGGTASTTINVTVNPLPATGTISGTASIADGSQTTLIDGVGGGVWSSDNTPVAAISGLGVVSGVSVGTATISYAVTGACGTAYATFGFTVTDNAPTFNNGATQPLTVCINAAATSINSLLVVTDPDAAQTETWSVLSGPAHGALSGFSATAGSGGAAITPAGLTYTPTAGYSGTDAFTIKVDDGHGGTASITINVTVNPLPATGNITGTASVTAGSTTTLSDGISGGAWTSDNTTVAIVNGSGVVTGVSAGNATISYGVTGTCGTAYATLPFTVNALVSGGGSSGDTFYVNGNHIYDPCGNQFIPRGINYSVLDDWNFPDNLTSGGELSTQIMQAHPNIVRVGWWINYQGGSRPAYALSDLDSVITRFAKDSIVVDLTVMDFTGYTTGYDAGDFLADTLAFRNSIVDWWTSAPVVSLVQKHKNTMIINVANEWGNVEYNANPTADLAIFTTAYKNAINSMRAVGINVPLLVDGPDYANDIAEITAVGPSLEASDPLHNIILGEHAYWANSACATNDTATMRSKVVELNTESFPVVIEETGNWAPSCDGTVQCSDPININFLLTACQSYGMGWLNWEWFDDCNTRQMTNDGTYANLTGIGDTIINNPVYGLAAHAIKTPYMMNGGSCSGLAPISGVLAVCPSSTTGLSDASTGGVWSTGNSGIATVGSSSGIVTGVAVGTATISYTLSGSYVTTTVTVSSSAVVGNISGVTSVCLASTTNLSDATTGGAWTSANTAIATVSSTGIVTGVSNGPAVISYSITNGCGSAVATQTITVNTAPATGNITGTASVTAGSTTTLSDGISGGVWSSGNTPVAAVNSSGVVIGVSAGNATISYGVTGTCGTAYATLPFTVNALVSGGGTSGDTFYVNGNHIYDPCGNQFIPRGINYSVLDDWNFPDNLTSGGELSTQIMQAHPNIVRVGWWINYQGGSRPAYALSDLDSVITRFAKDSIVVDLTVMDFTGYTTGYDAGDFLADTLAFRNSIVDWWTSAPVVSLVQKHKNTMIINVANEWGNVEYNANPTADLAIFTTAYKNAINSMRAVGINVPLLVDGPDYANDIAEITAVGPSLEASDPLHNIILGEHAYWANSACATNDTATMRSKVVELNTESFPVVIEETGNWAPSCDGTVQCSDAINIDFLLTACQSYGMGWLNWEWFDDCNTRQMTNDGTYANLTGIGDTIINNPVYGLAAHAIKTPYMMNGGSCSGLGPISGVLAVCPSSTTGLSDASTGGVWSTGNSGIATVGSASGIVTGVAVGTATISYTLSGSYVTTTVTVGSSTTAGNISGVNSVCPGLTTNLSDAIAGGAWTSANTSAATISSTGVVTGVANGSAVISYLVTGGCGSAVATATVTVGSSPAVGNISGVASVCPGQTTKLSDATTGGAWTSANTSAATVSSTGVVTGVTGGSVAISYTITGGCGNAVATTNVTVNPLAVAGTISGGNTAICSGGTTDLSDAITGGAWTSGSPSVAVVSNTGVVTGVSGGNATISYTVTNGCGPVSATKVITVNPVSPISGVTSICSGTTTLSDAIAGGTWSSSDNTVAAIGPLTGIVTAGLSGSAVITYSLTTGCVVTTPVNIGSLAAITGSTSACVGIITTLSDATPGGTWSSSNAAVASIGANTGVISGIGVGTATITYKLGTTCYIVTPVTVSTGIAAVTGGVSSLCSGATTTFYNTTTGGVWSSSATGVATVSATGVVTGVSGGTAAISYSAGAGCARSVNITINPKATLSGTTAVCAGQATTLSNSIPGGSWTSASVGVATVVAATGVVSGVAAGTTSISYTLPTGCASSTSLAVHALSATTGNATVCGGATLTLYNTTTGSGTWSSSNTLVATVGSTGIVTAGAAASSATVGIIFTTPAGCVTTKTITVNTTLPITGIMAVCTAQTTTLANGIAGGNWTSSNVGYASVVAGTGVVTGVAPGAPVISYTLPSGCFSTATVNVSALSTITGAATVCGGHVLDLYNTTTGGGMWSSSNTLMATVSSTGVVTGGATAVSGNVTISFTAGAGCAAAKIVTVNASLPITGILSVCTGQTTTVSNSLSGGAWSSSNAGNATVTPGTGIVSGMATGSPTISYSLPSGCISLATVTVNPLSPITGTLSVCAGRSTQLYDITPGVGVWHSGSSFVAIINSSGVATGISSGTSLISFTTAAGCLATKVLTVTLCRMEDSTTNVNAVSGIDNIQLFPNPNAGIFTIRGSLTTQDDADVSVEITDMLGQVIFRKNILAHEGNIDEQIQLNNTIANSMYLVNIRSGATQKVFHIVIER